MADENQRTRVRGKGSLCRLVPKPLALGKGGASFIHELYEGSVGSRPRSRDSYSESPDSRIYSAPRGRLVKRGVLQRRLVTG